MALFRQQTTRRREIRKTLPKPQPQWRSMATRPNVLWAALFIIVYVGVAGWFAVESRFTPNYRPGQIVDAAQVARVPFQAVDLKATNQARERARAEVPAVYTPNQSYLDTTAVALETLPTVAAAAPSLDKVAIDIRTRFGLTEAALAELRRYHTEEGVDPAWQSMVREFMGKLVRHPMVPTERYQLESQNLTLLVRVRLPEGADVLVPESDLVNLSDDQQIRKAVQELATPFPDQLRPIVARYFLSTRKPTFQHDPQATEAARAAAAEDVEPQITHYEPNQVIVPASVELDTDGYRLLVREQEAYEAALDSTDWIIYRLGPLFTVLLVGVGIAICVAMLRPRIGENPVRAMALTTLLLLTLALGWMIRPIGPYTDPLSAIAPAILAAVVLTIAYDALFASAIVILHTIVASLLLELTVPAYLATVAGTILCSIQVREIRQRGTLIRAGFTTGIVMFLAVIAAQLTTSHLVTGIYREILIEASLAGLGTLSVGFFVLGVLPYIEKIFRVTTAMTLLELCDVNQPLLRRMAQSAPGTYNHSLVVGTLAENAAEAISANGLLARVGAYYHDIGKINKPQYFVENRVANVNLHEKLSPAMSLLIIVGHVKDGIELAREYGLPPVLHHFIEAHHGTTLVEYFYHEARKNRPENEQPDEIEYRYPGPRPRTREAAILMLCDAVESASRSMAEPTATRIEQLVQKIALKRLLDGQFDDCDITLRELNQVEASLTRSLAAIYHGRIAYPASRDEARTRPLPPSNPAPAGKADGRAAG